MKTCPVCDTPYPDQRATCPTDGAVLIETRELEPDHIIRNKYRIIRKLGQGGMGVVYLAEHSLLGGQVALKFLAAELSRNPQFVKRFRNEARAAYQLRHPNIVEVTDLDQDEDGTLFIAMEYVPGPSLRTVLREAKGPLPVVRALQITREIAGGLAAAHVRGAIHRDIKPENVLVRVEPDGRLQAKVLDFGIAVMTDNITNFSRTHGLLLTPEYAAPEQWRGTPGNELDGRTDLYALGCILYEMLAGRTPFNAVNPEGWMFAHLQGVPDPLNTVRPDLARDHPELEPIVMRLLARDREQRFASAVALLEVIVPMTSGTHPAPPMTLSPQLATPPGAQHVVTPIQAVLTPVAPPPQPEAAARPSVAADPKPAPVPTPPPEPQPVRPPASPTVPRPPTPRGPLAASEGAAAARQRSPAPKLAAVAALIIVVGVGLWFGTKSLRSTPQAAVPTLIPPGGTYSLPQLVAISDATPNAAIHYTLDGTPPNESSPIYTQALDGLPSGTVVRAMATAPGHTRSHGITGVYLWSGVTNPPPNTQNTEPPSQANSTQQNAAQPGPYDQGKSAYDHKKYDEARTLFSQACDAGEMRACNYLGYLYAQGLGGTRDTEKARTIYQGACEQNNLASCASLGSLFQDAGNTSEARKYFKKACDGGLNEGCTLLHGVQ
ncbi:MAG TPA: protein kinase [Candidatus Solibacter sp.]|nr:protein kinase [Candidatus Solibacter sp.]